MTVQSPRLLASASTLGELRGVRLYMESLGIHGEVVYEPSQDRYHLVNDALFALWLRDDKQLNDGGDKRC